MTKREVLRAICEMPGWQPPAESSSIDRSLAELQSEGWVLPRLDGWEATPAALEAYPHFTLDDAGRVQAGRFPDPPDPALVPNPGPTLERGPSIPVERVEAFVRALLDEVPLVALIRAITLPADMLPAREGEGEMGWKVACELVERYLDA